MHGLFVSSTYNRSGNTAALSTLQGQSGLKTETLAGLLARAKANRMIDGYNNPECIVNYPEMLQEEFVDELHCPFTATKRAVDFQSLDIKTPTVGVIGGGMSGLLTALQLIKAGFRVQLFESSPEPNSFDDLSMAGRICTVKMNGKDESAVELGAMRFPARSYLFWHYAKYCGLLDDNSVLTEFPNPMVVPSSYNGETLSYGVWHAAAMELPDEERRLQIAHLDHFRSYTPNANLGTTSNIMNAIKTSSNPLGVHRWWRAACKDLYGLSYQQFLERKFSRDDIEKIGNIGLGTGGFAPLFGVSALEMMRLFVWDYSEEFAVSKLREYPIKLLEKIRKISSAYARHGRANIFLESYNSTVTRLYYSSVWKSYRIETSTPKGGFSHGVDYVVLAMTHTAAAKLLNDSAANVANDIMYARDDLWAPYFDRRLEAGEIAKSLRSQTMMSAVKYFHTMTGPAGYDGRRYPYTITAGEEPIRSVFGTFVPVDSGAVGIGTTYALPVSSPSAWSGSFKTQKKAIGLHYSWGEESRKFGDRLKSFLYLDAGVSYGIITYSFWMVTACSNLIKIGVHGRLHDMSVGLMNKNSFGDLFMHDYGANNQGVTARAVVWWDRVPGVWGGFKLDDPNSGAHLVYAFRVLSYSVADAGVKKSDWNKAPGTTYHEFYGVHPSSKRCYFAGDSFSHYGGWVEGAFQSAINTTAGILRAQLADYPRTSGDFYGHFKRSVCDALLFSACDPYSFASGISRR